MSSNGYAHICAGVRIEDHIEISEQEETRDIFDPHTGKKQGTFNTLQFTYTIFGKKMPIQLKEYPTGGYGTQSINLRYGWDMRQNFNLWLQNNGFAEPDSDELRTVFCLHTQFSNHQVTHPTGILGATLKTYSSSDTYLSHANIFKEIALDELAELREVARKRLEKVGCTEPPKLYLFAKQG